MKKYFLQYTDHKIEKIAVFRALYLGDMLCLVPALRALRHFFPDSEISLIGLPWSVAFAKRFPGYVDKVIPFPGYEGLPEQIPDKLALLTFLEDMQSTHFDLVLQMQGNGTIINRLVKSFEATYTAGFYKFYRPASPFDLFMEYPEGIPEINRHLKLLEFLGIPGKGTFLEFPITQQDRENFSNLNLPFIKNQYICIHPGSRSIRRQWQPKYFASVADYAASQGFEVVITGTSEELPITREVEKFMKYHAINLAGKTTLGTVAILIRNAYALFSNCTGVSHIAAAVKTPSVIINMDGEPERWSPLNRTLHHVHDWKREPSFSMVFEKIISMVKKRKLFMNPKIYNGL